VVDPGAGPGGVFHHRRLDPTKRGEGPGDGPGGVVLCQSRAGEDKKGGDQTAGEERHASFTDWHGGGFQESLPAFRAFCRVDSVTVGT
jgi:hypothetical protein